MADFEARVEPTDHLDWVDVVIKRKDTYRVVTLRSIDELYELKHAIEVYIWEHENEQP